MTVHGIALIGLGLAVQPHAQALSGLGGRIDVRWAASRSPERCAAFTAQYGFPTTTDIDRALSDPSVRSVMILTPPASHLDLVRRAAAAGKHILIEKPLALTSAEAADCVAVAEAAHVRLGVVLQHRFRPNALRLAEALSAGRLGTIAAANVQIPWWRPQSYYDEPGRGTFARDGGGVLLTQAIHTLDLFRSLAGPVARVAGLATTTSVHTMETEDFAGAVMELAGGGIATAMATTAFCPGSAESIHLIGSRGSALLSGNSLTLALHDGTTDVFAGEAQSGAGANPMDFSCGPHMALIADFLDAVEAGRAPTVSGDDALATQRLIDAILGSSQQRCWIDVPAR